LHPLLNCRGSVDRCLERFVWCFCNSRSTWALLESKEDLLLLCQINRRSNHFSNLWRRLTVKRSCHNAVLRCNERLDAVQLGVA
jgi:DNA-binding HxlR family transcriptional regulator